jgi:hypothetical protein
MVRYFFIALLLVIMGSLVTALIHLMSGRGDDRMVKALTWRIGLSIGLLVLLLLAHAFGLISPNVV